MSMAFTFTVSLSVRRESGKFASREDVASAIETALQEIEPDVESLGPDGDSVYVVDDISVVQEPPPKRKKVQA